MKLTDNQLKILKFLREGAGENYYYYRTIEGETGLTREVIKAELKPLKEIGVVEYCRGLFDEDGETAGSGLGVAYEKIREADKLITAAEGNKPKHIHVEFTADIVSDNFDGTMLMEKVYNLPGIRVFNPSWREIGEKK
jgi:hypothetical protein